MVPYQSLGPGSTIHVQADQIRYCKTVLHSMLPRESSSKECCASILSILSFPAFAVEDARLVERTRDEIVSQLQGRYGCKRFLRDGHHCENEDRLVTHYIFGHGQAWSGFTHFDFIMSDVIHM